MTKKHTCENGCGPKNIPFPVPQFRFNSACNQHDRDYCEGGSEKDKENADKKFLKSMLESAGWNLWYYFWAYLSYAAVVLFGTDSFNYKEEE